MCFPEMGYLADVFWRTLRYDALAITCIRVQVWIAYRRFRAGAPRIFIRSVRFLLIDDHRVIRKGLRALLEGSTDFEVGGEAGGRAGALPLIESVRPNLVLLDLDLGSTTSLDFLGELLATGRDLRVLVLTGVRDKALQRQAIQLGAMGIVLKDHAAEVLVEAIQKVAIGEMWLDRSTIVSLLCNPGLASADPEGIKIPLLTEREREIIP